MVIFCDGIIDEGTEYGESLSAVPDPEDQEIGSKRAYDQKGKGEADESIHQSRVWVDRPDGHRDPQRERFQRISAGYRAATEDIPQISGTDTVTAKAGGIHHGTEGTSWRLYTGLFAGRGNTVGCAECFGYEYPGRYGSER